MMRIFKLLCIGLPLFILASCDDDDQRVGSESLTTNQFYTSFIVVDDGSDELYAEAQLTRGGPPNINSDDDFYIDLQFGDALWLSNGDESIFELDLSENLFEQTSQQSDKHQEFVSANNIRDQVYFLFVWGFVVEWGTFYSVAYDRPADELEEYTVTLSRDYGEDLFKSSVRIPEAFEIASPSNGTSFDRSEDEVEIIWTDISGTAAQVQVTASTTCVDGSFEELTDLVSTDTGSYTFAAGALDSEILDGTCSTSIAVAKVILGQLNSSFAGGSIQGQQVRRLTLSSVE